MSPEELALGLAKTLPEEFIIDMLAEAIISYKEEPTQERKGHLRMSCAFLFARLATEDRSTQQVMQDFEFTRKAKEFFKPNQK